MTSIVFWTSFYSLVISASSIDPTSKVTVDCGDGESQPSAILFSEDVRAVFAYGAGEEQCDFTERETPGLFDVTVHYDDTGNCKFRQSAPERIVYSVTIETRKTHPMIEVLEDERYHVICNFMSWSQAEKSFGVVSRFKPPIMDFKNEAEMARSTFKVYMVNIVGQPLTGPLIEKRVVKLRAEMTPPEVPGDKPEVGFAPVQCIAQADQGGPQLVILSDGCGTGFPWKVTEGFTMNGVVGTSPKFRLFKVHRNMGIKINCHFVICEEPCDVNSCPAARSPRSKRDAESKERVYLHALMSNISIGMNDTFNDKTDRSARPHRVNISAIPRMNVNPNRQGTVSERRDNAGRELISNGRDVNEPSTKDSYPAKKRQTEASGEEARELMDNAALMEDGREDKIHYSKNNAIIFIGLSTFSSLILLTTIVLTTFVLSKIHHAHQKILEIKTS